MSFFALCAACGSGPDSNRRDVHFAPGVSSSIPFSTKEPDDFQAEMIVTAGGKEKRTFLARKGVQRRIDFNYGTAAQYTTLQTDRTYMLSDRDRTYAAAEEREGDAPGASLLPDGRMYTEFEEVGSEGDHVTYRARSDAAGSSEILIYVDRSIGLPVRQEFYSLKGDDRVLQFTSEIRNFRIGADEALFSVPSNYRKISPEEFIRRTYKLPTDDK